LSTHKVKYRVGVLGATGTVGQQFISLLEGHPWFEVTAVVASERSAGKRYEEATPWRLASPMPAQVKDLIVQPLRPDIDCDLVFSALDAAVAGPAEEAFARAGYPVISNSRNHRMDETVPLLMPEVNAQHIALIPRQRKERGFERGFIVTNPNCSAGGLVVALKPIEDAFGIEAVSVVTFQALSGAGYPGVPSSDLLDNVIPYIGGEEEKLEVEPRKILGTLVDDTVRLADMTISAQCNRVPVLHGHLECVSLRLKKKAAPADIVEVLRGFQAEPQKRGLPSAPAQPIVVREEENRPQPRFDRDAGKGMTVVVGRVRPCPVLDIRLVVLAHNLVRGAAGAAILNAELLVEKGYIVARERVETTAKS